MLNDIYQGLDPIAFSLGPLVVRWYGLAYVLGFVCAAAIIYFVAKRWKLGMSEDNLLTLMVCAIVGVVLGARIGYVLFYGDGYYREGKDWYVPGYKNFTVDEDAARASVVIAAAKSPMLYVRGSYGNSSAERQNNRLYWLEQNLKERRDRYTGMAASCAAGVLLLAVWFLLRGDKRRADAAIARVTGRVWYEGKLLLLLAALAGAAKLNILSLGDEAAHSLGVNVRAVRLGMLAVAAVLAGAAVSFAVIFSPASLSAVTSAGESFLSFSFSSRVAGASLRE